MQHMQQKSLIFYSLVLIGFKRNLQRLTFQKVKVYKESYSSVLITFMQIL